jgi:hypothetical protein
VGRLGSGALQAAVGWSCVCIPLGFLLYIALMYLLRRNGKLWPRLRISDAIDASSPIC